MKRLNNKRALVTGSSSGIGKGIAEAFASEGAAVTVCGRDRDRTEACREAIAATGAQAHAAIGDLAEAASAERLVAEAAEAMGGLDLVVNNAGGGEAAAPLDEYSLGAWQRTLNLNLTIPFVVSKAAVPHMLEAGGGAFLHISSVCSITTWPGESAYCVAKAGLNMLSNQIAVEYAARGIRSNTVMPAVVRTKTVMRDLEEMADGGDEILAKHPIGRFGEVEEIAKAAVFLCSDESRYLTGANVPIDGAYSLV